MKSASWNDCSSSWIAAGRVVSARYARRRWTPALTSRCQDVWRQMTVKGMTYAAKRRLEDGALSSARQGHEAGSASSGRHRGARIGRSSAAPHYPSPGYGSEQDSARPSDLRSSLSPIPRTGLVSKADSRPARSQYPTSGSSTYLITASPE